MEPKAGGGGRGWLTPLCTVLGAAGGALAQSLLEPFKGNPAALVAITLAVVVVVEHVAIVALWIAGYLIHPREHRDVVRDRDRLRSLVEIQGRMVDVATQQATKEGQSR